ncbi:Polyketide cyclase / dehydrase and lipid transport [Jatrophihabitans endophyticus]|uniref:Polyketide cyclase / dehydrase and lipid transport n=1 Tax=Jatrophihabitans endophyticus TaxID=1206085 RepID=A0A1M5MH15_9ACTN|nr:SRPBCC family protein [Jatrophihabitans endophyticus]SHG76507.1 Polyketide cyclase / dehydrase and lipid transport [Jatrophihabitans endophyticus]
MRTFVLTQDSPHAPAEAWRRITDWPAHGRWVPLTTIAVTTPAPDGEGVGTVFTARTAVGPLGFDDPMEVVAWRPPSGTTPGRCRLEKRGRVMLGWAEITVEPHRDGSRTTWTEAARPRGLPRVADRLAAVTGRLLFGRVLRRLLAA